MTRRPSQRSHLEVGRVGRAHGLRGEVRVKFHWPESDALFEVSQVRLVWDGGPERAMRLTSVRPVTGGALVAFEGIGDRDAAGELSGARVLVSRSELPALAEGEYYLSDLVGAEVFAPDGLVGTVTEIGLHPTLDTLVIDAGSGVTVEQPLLPEWVHWVDAEAGRVELKSRDGLIGAASE